MRYTEIANGIGKGIVAGLAGTMAITGSMMLENKLRMLPGLRLTPPARTWGPRELTISALHHSPTRPSQGWLTSGSPAALNARPPVLPNDAHPA